MYPSEIGRAIRVTGKYHLPGKYLINRTLSHHNLDCWIVGGFGAKKKVADNQSFRRRLSEATLSASFLNTLHITRVVEVFELGITPLELPVDKESRVKTRDVRGEH